MPHIEARPGWDRDAREDSGNREHPVDNLNPVNLQASRNRHSFARSAAADAFGGRYWGWREWDTFTDRAPDDEPPTVWGPR